MAADQVEEARGLVVLIGSSATLGQMGLLRQLSVAAVGGSPDVVVPKLPSSGVHLSEWVLKNGAMVHPGSRRETRRFPNADWDVEHSLADAAHVHCRDDRPNWMSPVLQAGAMRH